MHGTVQSTAQSTVLITETERWAVPSASTVRVNELPLATTSYLVDYWLLADATVMSFSFVIYRALCAPVLTRRLLTSSSCE